VADGRRTENDGVELVGALVRVRQQDAAGLEDRQELGLAGLGQSCEKLVATFCDSELKSCCVVCDIAYVLHVHCELVRRCEESYRFQRALN
jgi:hypothetical protein